MSLEITHGHLLACPCNEKKPDQGWYSPPSVHYVNCPDCGEFFAGDTDVHVAAQWNATVRSKRLVQGWKPGVSSYWQGAAL